MDGIERPGTRAEAGRFRLGALRPGPVVLVGRSSDRAPYLRRLDLAPDRVPHVDVIDLADTGIVGLTATGCGEAASRTAVVRLPGSAERVVQIRAGETAHAALALRGAGSVTFDVHLPRADPSTAVEVEVHDERGARVFHPMIRYRHEPRSSDRSYDVFATEASGFGPGPHELTARTGSGRVHRTTFFVPREGGELTVRVEL